MRRALAKGTFVPAREGNRITGRAQGPTVFTDESNIRQVRRESKAWSDAHSRSPYSAYSPKYEGRKLRRYYDAFVNPSTRANRIENGLASLYTWLVDEQEYYTAQEFDEKYTGDL